MNTSIIFHVTHDRGEKSQVQIKNLFEMKEPQKYRYDWSMYVPAKPSRSITSPEHWRLSGAEIKQKNG